MAVKLSMFANFEHIGTGQRDKLHELKFTMIILVLVRGRG